MYNFISSSSARKLKLIHPKIIIPFEVIQNINHLNHERVNYQSTRSFGNNAARVPFYGQPRPKKNNSVLSPIEKLSLAITSGTSVLLNPERADALAALSEVTGTMALQSIYDKMINDDTGKQILQDKPIVDNNAIDIQSLVSGVNSDKQSSDGDSKRRTFGEAYGQFMLQHGFDPDERSKVKYVSDPELAYVMLRYRQCHDFFHTLFELPPTVLGELALKYVELFQTGLPSTALSVTLGRLQLTPKERYILHTIYLPWAVQIGTKSKCFLLNVYYENELDTDLDELREQLGVFPAPDPLNVTKN